MPVQQHPIPQNVTSYQFRLVGDMTLKQFLQLAAGIIIGIVIYALPLPGFFKWPLIILFVGTGAAIAFLPVQGRPLDQWILAFIRSIYAPTIYSWQKPQFAQSTTMNHTPTTAYTTALQSAQTASPQAQPATSPASVTQTNTDVTTTSTTSHPNLVPRIHTLTRTAPPPPATQPTPEQFLATAKNLPRSAKNVYTTKEKPLTVEKQPRPQQTHVTPTQSAPPQPQPTPTTQPVQPGTSASFSTDLPIPSTPQTPNTIVGMTLTDQGKIIDTTIIEILKNGQTIRATKSNKLGQFLFAKPLDDGIYQITADNTGFVFPRFDLKLDGNIIPPIRLQATKKK